MSDDRPDYGYLLKKRGYFYRTMSRGYTGVIEEAGRYSLEEAESHCADVDGVTFVHESEMTGPYADVMGPADIALHEKVTDEKRTRRLAMAGSSHVSDAEYTALLADEYCEELWDVFELPNAEPLALAQAAELVGREIHDEEMRGLSVDIDSMVTLGCKPETMERLRGKLQDRYEAALENRPQQVSP